MSKPATRRGGACRSAGVRAAVQGTGAGAAACRSASGGGQAGAARCMESTCCWPRPATHTSVCAALERAQAAHARRCGILGAARIRHQEVQRAQNLGAPAHLQLPEAAVGHSGHHLGAKTACQRRLVRHHQPGTGSREARGRARRAEVGQEPWSSAGPGGRAAVLLRGARHRAPCSQATAARRPPGPPAERPRRRPALHRAALRCPAPRCSARACRSC